MNERIQELIKECEITSTSYFHGRGNITDTYFDREKFAKLIVQECSGFVYNYPERYLTRGQAREICLSMEEHFGVNE
jgi:hypothetical protein